MAGVRGGGRGIHSTIFSYALKEASQKAYTGPVKRSNYVRINPEFVLCLFCRQVLAPPPLHTYTQTLNSLPLALKQILKKDEKTQPITGYQLLRVKLNKYIERMKV